MKPQIKARAGWMLAAAVWLALAFAACHGGAANPPAVGAAPVHPVLAPVLAAGNPAADAISAATPVEVETNTAVAVRLDQPLDAATAQPGQTFRASLAAPITVNGAVAIPQGAEVTGIINAVDTNAVDTRRALSLTRLQFSDESYDLATHPLIPASPELGTGAVLRFKLSAPVQVVPQSNKQ